jgi:hypothetical protein
MMMEEICRIVDVGSTQSCNRLLIHAQSLSRLTPQSSPHQSLSGKRDTAPIRPVRDTEARNPLHNPICVGHCAKVHDHDRPTRTDSSQSATMPSEVSDIKQFIEICRRKDAKCTSYNSGGRRSQEEEARHAAHARGWHWGL